MFLEEQSSLSGLCRQLCPIGTLSQSTSIPRGTRVHHAADYSTVLGNPPDLPCASALRQQTTLLIPTHFMPIRRSAAASIGVHRRR